MPRCATCGDLLAEADCLTRYGTRYRPQHAARGLLAYCCTAHLPLQGGKVPRWAQEPAAHVGIVGRPLRLAYTLLPDVVEREQRLDCAHRMSCLDRAARLDWRAFSCRACTAYEPQTDADRVEELRQLLQLSRVVGIA